MKCLYTIKNAQMNFILIIILRCLYRKTNPSFLINFILTLIYTIASKFISRTRLVIPSKTIGKTTTSMTKIAYHFSMIINLHTWINYATTMQAFYLFGEKAKILEWFMERSEKESHFGVVLRSQGGIPQYLRRYSISMIWQKRLIRRYNFQMVFF